ncbi:hypothetical protein DOTSEDRAFT_67475 [Dothistroma septosporum NZE10]|uniref:Uncharacterized protein n=1 Tax=Dothistroma septosporum (strain NZE10 / CBS 128990) TaxID=675120 RepID=N1PZJ9_DOTSN|nr:hypothetical protein DOTSEDRAFT_67475 [Dothistroma septosporum NZE10]
MRSPFPITLALCASNTLARRLFQQPVDLSIRNLDILSTEKTVGSPLAHPPAKIIKLDDIVPVIDANGNARCCPIGTVNNGIACVFPESSVCPPGTRLVGSLWYQRGRPAMSHHSTF